MCGISGILKRPNSQVNPKQLERMNELLKHRGPDGNGIWNKQNVGLAHTRLAIIDLSDRARQPMSLVDNDRYIVTFNGEIYNHASLREELKKKGYRFASGSDTEVVLAAYSHWGNECVEHFNGMFAFAIWDNKAETLSIFRDRYGIKPVYYYKSESLFVFASEQRPILDCLQSKASLNLDAIHNYFTFQNIFGNETFNKDVFLLNPATILTVKFNANRDIVVSEHKYWDYQFKEHKDGNKNDYKEELIRLIKQAVDRNLISDVEIGSYLSGGLDSGTITSLAASKINNLKTFTCGFDISHVLSHEREFDERIVAERISSACNTEHYQYLISSNDIERTLPKIVYHLEEPRVGQSYPNFCAARLAAKFSKVCLSGAGGDELFAGYPWRYRFAQNNNSDFVTKYYGLWQRLTTASERKELFLNGNFFENEEILRANFENILSKDMFHSGDINEQINASLYFEAKTFLHGLLVVEDKLSMAHGLETRVPFLDNDLVDFAMACPVEFKLDQDDKVHLDENEVNQKKIIKYSSGKIILREAMKAILPPGINGLKKQGFSAPDETWFRNRSEKYIRSKILDKSNQLYEILNYDTVKKIYDNHVSHKQNRRLFIWSVLYCCEYFDQNMYANE